METTTCAWWALGFCFFLLPVHSLPHILHKILIWPLTLLPASPGDNQNGPSSLSDHTACLPGGQVQDQRWECGGTGPFTPESGENLEWIVFSIFFLICLPLQRRDYRGASVYGQMWSMNLECCLAHSRHSKNILWNNTEKKIMVRTFQGGPRDVTQSEMSEREKQMPYINVYIWNLEKWYRWTCLQSRSRDMGVENKCVGTKWGKGTGANWEIWIDIYIYTLLILRIRYITNENLL